MKRNKDYEDLSYKAYNKFKSDVEHKEKMWSLTKPIWLRLNQLDEEKKEIFQEREKIKFSTTKLLIAFLFLNCTVVEVFTIFSMFKMLEIAEMTGAMMDFTPLVTLIGTVIGEVLGFGIYSLKAAKENSKGGITYETAMFNLNSEAGDEPPY